MTTILKIKSEHILRYIIEIVLCNYKYEGDIDMYQSYKNLLKRFIESISISYEDLINLIKKKKIEDLNINKSYVGLYNLFVTEKGKNMEPDEPLGHIFANEMDKLLEPGIKLNRKGYKCVSLDILKVKFNENILVYFLLSLEKNIFREIYPLITHETITSSFIQKLIKCMKKDQEKYMIKRFMEVKSGDVEYNDADKLKRKKFFLYLPLELKGYALNLINFKAELFLIEPEVMISFFEMFTVNEKIEIISQTDKKLRERLYDLCPYHEKRLIFNNLNTILQTEMFEFVFNRPNSQDKIFMTLDDCVYYQWFHKLEYSVKKRLHLTYFGSPFIDEVKLDCYCISQVTYDNIKVGTL